MNADPLPAVPDARRAGFWVRVLAQLIDGALLALVGGVVINLVMRQHALDAAIGGPGAILSLLYFSFFRSWMGGGQTVGMRFLGLRVLGIDGQRLANTYVVYFQ